MLVTLAEGLHARVVANVYLAISLKAKAEACAECEGQKVAVLLVAVALCQL